MTKIGKYLDIYMCVQKMYIRPIGLAERGAQKVFVMPSKIC